MRESTCPINVLSKLRIAADEQYAWRYVEYGGPIIELSEIGQPVTVVIALLG